MAELKRTDLSVRLERALVIGIVRPDHQEADQDSLDELVRLAESAGARLAGRMTQRRDRPEPKTYLGKGKVGELALLAKETQADLVVANAELKPAQVKALETAVDTKVIDRTELILDIFASQARTRLARLQVELAQLEYALPRLQRMWTHLSRIEGGIGMRGPGEKQIEEDRRIARRRIAELKRKLEEIGERRERQAAQRRDHFTISLVGYTNSGKSTLLNRLTDSSVKVQDRLFATLDTKTSAWELPHGRSALLSDTVGFVQALPHTLVASFHATLVETRSADLLLHVVDLGAKDVEGEIRAVERVLREIGADRTPHVMVFNKSDLLEEPVDLIPLRSIHPDHAVISALRGKGIGELTEVVVRVMDRAQVSRTFKVPHSRSRIVSLIRESGRVVNTAYDSEGTILQMILPLPAAKRFEGMLEDGENARAAE